MAARGIGATWRQPHDAAAGHSLEKTLESERQLVKIVKK